MDKRAYMVRSADLDTAFLRPRLVGDTACNGQLLRYIQQRQSLAIHHNAKHSLESFKQYAAKLLQATGLYDHEVCPALIQTEDRRKSRAVTMASGGPARSELPAASSLVTGESLYTGIR